MPRPVRAVGPVPPGWDPDAYDRFRRHALWSIPTGLFVVGSRAGDRSNLMTANWVLQVATEPKLVAVSVEVGAVTAELVAAGGGFSVNVLSRADRDLARRFVKPVRNIERDEHGAVTSLQGQPVHEAGDGWPCLRAARWWLACRLCSTERFPHVDGPVSHVVFVGEVVDVGAADGQGDVPGRADGEGAEESPPGGEDPGILRMEDTRLSYGG